MPINSPFSIERLKLLTAVFSKGRELEKIGLRVPQITKIMLELREKGFNVPEGILTVDEAMDCISSLLDKEGKIW